MPTSEVTRSQTQGQREQEAKALHTVFANACSLYLMNRNFYWNASGPKQHTLKRVFKAHYTDLEETVDLLATRMRAQGITIKCSCSDILEFSTIHEPRNADTVDMPNEAKTANDDLIVSARAPLDFFERNGDTKTLDLLFEIITTHLRFNQTLSSLEA